MPSVAKNCDDVHENGGKYVRGCNEALSGRHIETHALVENLRQEIGDRVGVGGCKTKKASKTPNLEV